MTCCLRPRAPVLQTRKKILMTMLTECRPLFRLLRHHARWGRWVWAGLALWVLVVDSLLLSHPAGAQTTDPLVIQHMQAARTSMSAHQWDYANYAWRTALSMDENNLEAHLGLAETLMQSGHASEAVQHLAALRKRFDRLSVELLYAQALEQVGQYRDAAAIYQNNLKRVPLEAQSFQQLVHLLPQLSAAEGSALRAFLQATRQDAMGQARQALVDRQYERLTRLLAIGTAYEPAPVDLNDYAVALMLQGRYEPAGRLLPSILQVAQQASDASMSWRYHANAALILLGQRRSRQAVQQVETAIERCAQESDKARLYNILGFIYENQGKWPRAIHAYQRALTLDPALQKARLNLAYAHQKNMDFTQAVQMYQAAWRREPKNVHILNRLGFAYELGYKERLAIHAYRQAARLEPGHPEAHHNLALLYRKMGKNRLADQAYQKMMDIEFQRIESGQQAAPSQPRRNADQERERQARLLDFVDVFFAGEATTR